MLKTLLLISLVVLFDICNAQKTIIKSDSTKIDKKVRITGLIATYFQRELNTNGDGQRDADGFRLFKARLEVRGLISKKVGYNIMLDVRTPLHGGLVRDAVIELYHIKNHTIKIGRQKTQFGWENRLSSAEMYTIFRSEIAEGVGRGDNLRDNGVGIIGHIPLTKHLRIEDALTYTNGTRLDITGPSDFNGKKVVWGRLGLRYKNKNYLIHFGSSFGYGGLRTLGEDLVDPSDDIYMDIKRFGVDMQIDHKYFFLAYEYGIGKDLIKGETEYDEYDAYQLLLALKTKWDIGPLVRYDWAGDEWKVPTFGIYYGQPKDKFRIISNYIIRSGITDQANGHDDRFLIMTQVRF